MQGPLISLPTLRRTHSHHFCPLPSVHRKVFLNLEFSLCKQSPHALKISEDPSWSISLTILHYKCKGTSCNLWGLFLSPFLNKSSEKAGQEGAGWLWMGLHPTAPAGVWGLKVLAAQQPYPCNHGTGFGVFWAVRSSERPSPHQTPEEKMQEHMYSNHHLAFSIWTDETPSCLLSAEIFLGSNTSCSKQGTETLLSPQAVGPAVLSMQTDLWDESRAKLALILSKTQHHPRLQKQNQSVGL